MPRSRKPQPEPNDDAPLVRKDLDAKSRVAHSDELVRTIRELARSRGEQKKANDRWRERIRRLELKREQLAEDLDRGYALVNGKQSSLLE